MWYHFLSPSGSDCRCMHYCASNGAIYGIKLKLYGNSTFIEMSIMKRSLQSFLTRLLCSAIFLFASHSAFANHIIGMDLNYAYVSDSTYKITLVVYGDCAGVPVFDSLPTSTPRICIYDGNTSVTSILLSIQSPSAGVEITPVCIADSNQTTCTNLSNPVAGIKRFVYSGTYTLPNRSHNWRFIFAGYMSSHTIAGRSSQITNITSPNTSIIELVDTLDNTTYNNTNPSLTVLPTPYYCLNHAANYNPGAVDPDGDALIFQLVAGLNNTGASCTTSGTYNPVNYIGGHSGAFPIQTPTGTFSFSASTGQISFTPDTIQKALVVYNIRELRNDTLIGTSQREMVYTVVTCSTPPPTGYFSDGGNVTIDDSTNLHTCASTGPLYVNIKTVEEDTLNLIHIAASGLPSGSTFSVTNDSTNHAQGTLNWTTTGVTPGVYTFYITFTDNACPLAGSITKAFSITVNPQPNADTIRGLDSVCALSSITLIDTATGGTWSSVTPSIASVSTGGIVTGVAPGFDTIKYTVVNSCNTAVATKVIKVNPLPHAGVINGASQICQGTSITLTDTASAGSWISVTPSIATVTNAGVVTGVTLGADTIKFADTNSCGVAVATKVVTVIAQPDAGTIAGPSTVCVGGSITLTDTVSGGVWSRQNLNATVGSTTGVVTGVIAGTDTIKYNYSNTCGTAIATKLITIQPGPDAGTITGLASVCVGATITLADTAQGGTGIWSSTSTGKAAVSSSGVVTGVSGGADTIKYTVTGTCGTVSAIKVVTINPLANAGVISGASLVCVGSSITLTDTSGGGAGAWAISNATASVSGGVVTGMSTGMDTVKYTVTNICGSATAVKAITVSQVPSAGFIAGSSSVCVGSNITLTDTTSGGVWSSSARGTVSGGVVTGITAGADTVSYTVSNTCGTSSATKILTINPLPNAGTISGSSTVCIGSTLVLTDTTSGGVWTATNGNATVAAGTVTPVTPGTDTIVYTITNVCGTIATSKVITINALPNAGAIAGASSVCVFASIALADAAGGGVWSVSNARATVASGIVTGVSAGIDTVKYTVTNSCGVATAIKSVTVNPAPDAGMISGPSTVCAGQSISLADTSSGGTWSSTDNTLATVSGGVVTSITAGVDTIKYTVGNTCGTASASQVITVKALPFAGSITGSSTVCVGVNATLVDTAAGGIWSASNSHAIVSGGVVTGVSAGVDTISYTVTNSCGTAIATSIMTINPQPNAGAISGPAVVCVGSSITLADTASGGVWSANNSNAAVSGGVVTGVAAGSVTISYSVTVACGTISSTYPLTVNPLPNAGAISGASFICISGSATLIESVTGGTWSATNGNAVVLSSGLTGGITAGVDTILYTVTNSCGTAVASHVVTIGSALTTSPVTGASTVCSGSNITLSDSTSGGTWSSSNTTIASVNSSGVVHGVSAGSATISYIYTSTCGSFVATLPVTVNAAPNAGSITGSSSVCNGSTLTLMDVASGGTWSSGNTAVATVSGGVVTTLSAGTAVMSYSVTNSCGTANATKLVTVNASPDAGTITGLTSVCQFNNITLSDTALGGSWSSSNTSIATINTSGIITGLAPGAVTMTYTVTNDCGTVVATYPVTVNPAPVAGIITGGSVVCNGNTLTLTDTASGGSWTSSNAGIASVNTGGMVTGNGTGSAVISYSMTNSCGTAVATANVTVTPTPDAGTISGTTTVCQGASVTLSESASGGTWSSSDNTVATITSSGVVTGISGGTAVISYTSTTTCGTASAAAIVTVNPLPLAGSISGSSFVCIGAATTLSDATASGVGTWSSSNPAAATVDPAGVVTGVASGSSTISYSVTNGCGTAMAAFTVAVSPAPSSGTISGTTTFCQGTFSPLSETVSGGAWSSGNTAVATVNSSGVVTGVSGGTAVISYSIIGGCTGATATATVTVNPFPNAGVINGASTVCIGSAITLTDTASGGIWSSGNTSIASINSSGMVTGLTAGVVNIYYSLSNGCGATNATVSLTVSSAPASGSISGATAICPGAMTGLSESVSGGVWSSSNTAVATIDSAGIVKALASGVTNISYSITGACGTAVASTPFTVTTTDAGVISGTTTLCPGNSSTLSETVGGGAWSSSNTSVATVNSSGSVTAIAGGTATISYGVVGVCGLAYATTVFTVNPAPNAGTITGGTAICLTLTSALSDAVSGGAWSSSNSLVAPVDPSGVVTGLSIGTANITYTVSNGCGTVFTTVPVAVNTTPGEGVMIGATVICAGSTSPFTESAPGGVWSSSDTAVASVNNSGLVTGISGGDAIISYTVTTACGVAIATADMIIKPLPNAGAISGVSSLCVGISSTLTDTASGGIWSSGNPAIASINPFGVVLGATAGNVTITYAVTNSCGTANATFPMTIGVPPSAAGVITGTNTVCPGIAVTLTDTTSGGIWSSSNTAVVTVSASGVMTGVTGGSATISYTITNTCGAATATYPVTISTGSSAGTITSGSTSVCVNNTLTLGDVTPSGVWSSGDNTIATVDASGVVTGIAAGAVNISYTVANSCGTGTAIAAITVNPLPVVGAIAGGPLACVGATSNLTNSAPGGVWSSNNTAVATIDPSTGVLTGVAVGSATITYSVTSIFGCNTTVTTGITVNPQPDAGSISGATTTVCALSSITLTDAASGGVWSSSDTTLATVDASGIVTGVSFGSPVISYSVTNSCGTASATVMVNVNPTPIVTPITGPSHICLGNTVTLTEGSFTGTWTSTDPSVATVDASGVVTSLNLGTTTISYTLTNVFGCTGMAAFDITVNPSTDAGSISATTTTICPGATTAFTDAAIGGMWSSSDNTIATVDTTGLVTGVASGTATISYVVSNTYGCSSFVTADVVVNPAPVVSSIGGAATICSTSSLVLTDGVFGGVWTSSNTAVATVDPASGLLSGVSGGVTTISYTVTNVFGCSTTATVVDTIVAPPVVPAIAGSSNVCMSSTDTLTNALTGGMWSSSDNTIASVGPSGVVTGVAAGSANISYTASSITGCSTTVSMTLTVNPLPAVNAIGGPTSVCVGNVITATDVTGSGVWSTSDAAIASIDVATGDITGVAAGNVAISYTVTNGFGCSTTVTEIDTVNTLPVVAAISGAANVCIGGSIVLTDATLGGVWSSSDNTVSTVDASGNVTAVAFGSDNISYTVTNGFGCITTVMIPDTVQPLPLVDVITGTSSVCPGSTVAAADLTTGGAWSSSDATVATVDPVTGMVTGVASGSVTISYTVTSIYGCMSTATATYTVLAAPVVAGITGASSMCPASSVLLSDATSGGTWSSSNDLVSMVDASGNVSGVAPGVDTISYSVTNVSGCTTTVAFVDTVVALPDAGTLSGASDVCVAGITTLSSTVSGGVWSSADITLATVDPVTGAVTGVAAGTVNISYTVTNATGCATTAISTITVDPLPVVSSISGSATVCMGTTTTLSSDAGGVWASSDTAIAIINPSTGVVSGVTVGAVAISYTITNASMCSTTVTVTETVVAPPVVGAIGGSSAACVGGSILLTDTTSGGVWSSDNTAIATVTSTGDVTMVSAGSANVIYTVTNAAGCSASVSKAVSTVTLPVSTILPAVTSATLCHGNPVAMSVSSVGGGSGLSYQWYRDGIAIAGAVASGYTATIPGSYTVTIFAGSCSETLSGINVIAPPNPVIVHGTGSLLYTGSFATYQWLFDGHLIPGAITSIDNASAAGVYNVVVTDGNGCTDTSAAYVVSGGTSSVQVVVNAADIKLFPNPATAQITIEAPVKVNVAIYSMDGKMVIRQDNATQVNISDLANAMYIIMVYDENNTLLKTDKFMKAE